MDVSRYVVGQGYGLDPEQVVRRGSFRALRTAVLLALVVYAVQDQVRDVVLVPPSADPRTWVGSTIAPGRLSLVLDAGLIAAYLMAAARALAYVRCRAPHPGWVTVARWARAAVVVGGVLDVVEDVRLFFLLEDRERGPEALSVSWSEVLWQQGGGDGFSTVVHLLVLASILVLLGCTSGSALHAWWLARRVDAEQRDPDRPETHAAPVAGLAGTTICCSGGGIRAAAFTMGGLQALRAAGVYDDARAVVAVSGGGYTAAAFHVARWSPRDVGEEHEDWRHPDRSGAFSPSSPETGWVRRHTRYLLGSFSTALQGALAVAFGIAVNLLLIGAVLLVTAWTLGTVLLASGRLGVRDGVIVSGSFDTGWSELAWVWVLPAAGAGLFVLRRAIEKWHTPSRGFRVGVEWLTAWLVRVGGTLALLTLLVPWILVVSNDDRPLGLVAPWSTLLNAVGGLSYDTALSASGDPVATSVGVMAIVTAVLGVVRAARSAGRTAKDTRRSRLWARLRDVVLPWVASGVVVLVLVALLLRMTAGVVRDPAGVASDRAVAVLLGLLLLAKVFTDANRTSLHHFYRWRIALAFLVRRRAGVVEPVPYRRPLRFSEAAPLDGGPELVSCAVANVADEELVPSDRGCVPFVFGHDRTGLTDRLLPADVALQPSAVYEHAADSRFRDATLPAALAISGAAFAPLAGRANKLVGPFRVVLALANARLGVWLPNPLYLDTDREGRRLRERTGHVVAAEPGPGADDRRAAGRDLALAEQAERRAGAVVQARRRERAGVDPAHHRALEGAKRALEFARGAAQRAAQWRRGQEAAYRTAVHAQSGAERSRRSAEESARRAWFRRTWTDVQSVWDKPGLTRVLKEAFGRASIYDRYLYVTDGGHYDNLGLVEALRRRPRRVVVLDASNDEEDQFSALGVAIATARMDLDCEVMIDPRQMRRLEEGRAPAAWCAGRYRYADGTEGTLFVAKAVMLDDMSWDVEAYVAEHPEFPRTSTVDQLYGELDFEAYRALGQFATDQLMAMPEFTS